MNSVLLSAGAACVILAVVGGGAKAFGVEVPVLNSVGRQLGLAGVGILFLVASYVLGDGTTVSEPQAPAVAAYRQEVLAACRSASSGVSGNPLAAAANSDLTFDRDRFVAGLRDQVAASRAIWEELWQHPVPRELDDEASAARKATDDAFVQTEAAINKIPKQLPRQFTFQDFAAFAGQFDAALRAPASRLDGAMSKLAGQPCNVSAPTANG